MGNAGCMRRGLLAGTELVMSIPGDRTILAGMPWVGEPSPARVGVSGCQWAGRLRIALCLGFSGVRLANPLRGLFVVRPTWWARSPLLLTAAWYGGGRGCGRTCTEGWVRGGFSSSFFSNWDNSSSRG